MPRAAEPQWLPYWGNKDLFMDPDRVLVLRLCHCDSEARPGRRHFLYVRARYHTPLDALGSLNELDVQNAPRYRGTSQRHPVPAP